MRKFGFMLMMLVVMGIAASCEKSEIVNQDFNSGKSESTENLIDPDREAAQKFVGLWTRTAKYEEQYSYDRDEYEFRFYEDGTGHMNIDTYDDYGKIVGGNYGPFTYEVKGEYLYITWSKDEPVVKFDYSFEGDTLFLHSDIDEYDMVYKFTKTEDADDKFVGDWETIYQDEKGRYVVYHYNFLTPTYGNTYKSVYEDINSAPQTTPLLFDFRYTFDDEKIYITAKGSEEVGPTITQYYRIDGTKLYLSGKADGVETMYSNFKKENGL